MSSFQWNSDGRAISLLGPYLIAFAQSIAHAYGHSHGDSDGLGAAYGVRYETFYFDESDSWLTGDYQLQYLQMMNRIADTGVDVVLITHIDSVIESVDQITEIVPIDSETSEVK